MSATLQPYIEVHGESVTACVHTDLSFENKYEVGEQRREVILGITVSRNVGCLHKVM